MDPHDNGDNEVVISTSQGQAIRFHERTSAQWAVYPVVFVVSACVLAKVIGMDIVQEKSSIFVISQFGYGKRTKVAQFTAHARGGVGIRSAVVNTKTGKLIGVKSLSDDETQEVIIISSQGQTIRLA